MFWFGKTKTWGLKLFRAPSMQSKQRQSNVLEIYCGNAPDRTKVGRLMCENSEFVFSYDAEFSGPPISAFPNKEKVYRSSHLWPFFAVRIPPFGRHEMRQLMESRSLREDQTIEILGAVARFSISNHYEFELVNAASNQG